MARTCHAACWITVVALAVGCADPVAEQIALLSSNDLETQLGAIDELRRVTVEDARVLPALAGTVGSPDPEVRAAAIATIGAAGDRGEPHLPVLLAALEDLASSVRVAAALAIRSIDPTDERGVEVLQEALLAGDGPVFLAVGRLGQDGAWATPTLIRLLKHRSARLRNVAAMTLGRIGPAAHESLDTLRRAEKDSEPTVRAQAQEAIRLISSGPSTAPEAS